MTDRQLSILIRAVTLHAQSLVSDSFLETDFEKLLTSIGVTSQPTPDPIFSTYADGVLTIRYPNDDGEIARIASFLGMDEKKLLALPLTEYRACIFEKLGGMVYDLESRLETWRTLRWPEDRADLPKLWKKNKGDIQRMYDSLPEQATLADRIGDTYSLTVSDARDMPKDENAGLSFSELMKRGVTILNPEEWMALLIAKATPADTKTYLAFDTWEWIGAITETFAADADSGSDGLLLDWASPEYSYSHSRARPVVR